MSSQHPTAPTQPTHSAIGPRFVRIGGAAGYWGDSPDAPRQLVEQGRVDYLVLDYLAEVTMSILVRARQKSPEAGYARDFIDQVMKPLLPAISERGIRVIVNAGGINVPACAAALRALADGAGLALRIGTVEGDDVMAQADALREQGAVEMFSGAPFPDRFVSANAYLGAFPIAAALSAGADVVITGRGVDSALALGALIHEFGWQRSDFDQLAAGTLAGHLIECGAQATGGNFTDWRDVVEGWDDMGYPIAVCREDGMFTIEKPADTGGRVSRLTVGEQMLYEIGDPSAYIVPDVVCDFSAAVLEEIGTDRVQVSGVKGYPPTNTYKVSATWADGWRSLAATVITGFDAVPKAQAFTAALLARTRRMFAQRGMADYRATAMHLIGAQTLWGLNADADARHCRELVLRIDVHHDQREALELFSKECTGVALSMTTGRCTAGDAGRPKVTPVIAQFAFLLDKKAVDIVVRVDEAIVPMRSDRVASWAAQPHSADHGSARPAASDADLPSISPIEVPVEVRLIELAVARSGDKGNQANVGVMARRPEYLPYIRAALTPARVHHWFAHVCEGSVTCYELPGSHSLNFVLTESLGGGGTSSLHLDSQAKTYGQQILAMPVVIPEALATGLPARETSVPAEKLT